MEWKLTLGYGNRYWLTGQIFLPFCSFLGIPIEKLNWHCGLQHLSLLFFLLQGSAEFTSPAITYKQTYRSTYLNSINSTCCFSSGLLEFSFAKSLLIIATYLRQSEMSATKQTQWQLKLLVGFRKMWSSRFSLLKHSIIFKLNITCKYIFI